MPFSFFFRPVLSDVVRYCPMNQLCGRYHWIPVSEILPQVICGFPTVSRLWPLNDGTHSKRALAIDQACYLQQAIRPSDM